jgi:hypothetical protein
MAYSLRTLMAVALAAIVVIIIVVARAGVRRYDGYLSGMWVGEPAFLEQAGLRDLQLFLAPREAGCRQGYLIIAGAGELISNQAIELRELGGGKRWGAAAKHGLHSGRDSYSCSVDVDYDDTSADTTPMPTRMKMTVSILDGTLTLFDDEKVYAFLVKDPTASAAAIEAYAA